MIVWQLMLTGVGLKSCSTITLVCRMCNYWDIYTTLQIYIACVTRMYVIYGISIYRIIIKLFIVEHTCHNQHIQLSTNT